MESYLIYIGKVAIAAGAFYLAFFLLFQNQKHFSFNRIYLPVSLALSFIIPLITFTTVKYIEPANFDGYSFAYLAPSSEEIIQPAFVFEWYHYLFGLYILGTAGFLFHLLLGHLKAINIIKKSRIQKIFDNLVNITKKDVHPFSFFSKIVVSEKTLSHPDLEMIVSHENIHVREKHTLDILFTEIIFLFQWFNPFAWLIKDAVKNNLEYLTDNEIAKKYNLQTYQLAMVTLADKQGIAPFLTALNGSQLKNRIIMMKKKKENKYAFLKQLVVLPLLAVLVMGLSNREVKTEVLKSNSKNTIESVGEEIVNNYVLLSDTVAVMSDETNATEKTASDNAEPKGSGYTISGGMHGKVKNGSENMKVTPSTQNGLTIRSTGDKTKQPLFVVDGKETENIENILPENIESISVLKDESSTIVYGEKGKNGVVLITTKTAANITMPEGVKANGFATQIRPTATIKSANDNGVGFDFGSFKDVDPSGPPLYIVDGIETTSIDPIQPDNIESIDVLKGKSAIELYGEKGKNGVVLITTKKYGQNDKGDVTVTGYGNKSALLGNPAPFGSATGKTNQPLVIINGKETGQTINNIDPETIQSVNVFKDENAIEKYGEKGKNGVIEIMLKPEIITTDLELRQFIAAKIKYPIEAQENGIVGKIGLAATFDKNGKVISIEDSNQKYQNLDEIVVTSINQGKIQLVQDNNSEILKKEVRRLINLLPRVEMTDFKEKTINIIVEFKLQD